nr:kinesin-like protein KIN12B [Tanacetum cinerariifolium]
KLTFLLQESLGGNAKLAMVCAISPVESCRSETYSTLRFAQRAKAIKNKAVVNEEMQDDVKSLREVIRQLKDELQRMKENGNQTDPGAGYSIQRDNDEEMEIVDEAEHVILAATEACKSLDSEFCTRQHTEIMQLNRLVQQYQHERECNSIIGQLQEDKIA